MSILINILLAVFALVAALMILVILMQRPKSEGLGAAFGGGVTENIFGAQTTNVLTKITTWLASIFFPHLPALHPIRAWKRTPAATVRSRAGGDEGMRASRPHSSGTEKRGRRAWHGHESNAWRSWTSRHAPAEPLTPADQAVGITAPAPSAEVPAATTPAPSASGQPRPFSSACRRRSARQGGSGGECTCRRDGDSYNITGQRPAPNYASAGGGVGMASGFGPAFSFKAWVNSCRLETICGAFVSTVLASFSE